MDPWLVGTYENLLYEIGGKNNRHYVTITYNETAAQYTWKKHANVQWTLYPTENQLELTVGTDCPYYSIGYTLAKIDEKGIYGPGNELYARKLPKNNFLNYKALIFHFVCNRQLSDFLLI